PVAVSVTRSRYGRSNTTVRRGGASAVGRIPTAVAALATVPCSSIRSVAASTIRPMLPAFGETDRAHDRCATLLAPGSAPGAPGRVIRARRRRFRPWTQTPPPRVGASLSIRARGGTWRWRGRGTAPGGIALLAGSAQARPIRRRASQILRSRDRDPG